MVWRWFFLSMRGKFQAMESCPRKGVVSSKEKLVEENFYLITEVHDHIAFFFVMHLKTYGTMWKPFFIYLS